MGEVRKVKVRVAGRSHVIHGWVRICKGVCIYSQCHGKPLKDFKQSDISFIKSGFGFNVGNRLGRGQEKQGDQLGSYCRSLRMKFWRWIQLDR